MDGSGVEELRPRIAPVPRGIERPFWSVMIPTFNCGAYLEETLKSVLVQDPGPEHMQIEVVDDCSTTGDPGEIVQRVGRGRVAFHRRTVNGGHRANFRTCLERSLGHWVHLLHGDDAVRSGFYAKLQAGIETAPEVGAAFTRFSYMDEHGLEFLVSDLERIESGVLECWLERIAVRQLIQTPSIVVRREVYETLGLFDARLSWVEDWEMWARIAAHWPVWFETEPLARYRMHSQSNTGRYLRTGENLRDVRRAVSIINRYLPAATAAELKTRSLRFWATDALENRARALARAGDWSGALTQVGGAVRCSPSFPIGVKAAKIVTVIAGLALCRAIRPIAH